MRAGFALLILLCGLAMASAQAPRDDTTRRVLLLALDNIQRAQCGTQACAPATAQEKANPPLTVAEANAVIQRAVLSGAAERCGLDWQRQNFVPMMAYWRQTRRKSERQMALVGLIHGYMQGQAQQMFSQRGPCTDQERQDLAARLPFRP
jgi:hypothetical protein